MPHPTKEFTPMPVPTPILVCDLSPGDRVVGITSDLTVVAVNYRTDEADRTEWLEVDFAEFPTAEFYNVSDRVQLIPAVA